MKPEKFIGIILITLLLSCEMEEQVDQKIGTVSFESNEQIMNSTFDIDVFIDGEKVGKLNQIDISNHQTITKTKLDKKLEVGVHQYTIKIYSYNGEPGKTLKGKFIIKQNKTSEVFIDFKNYNNWI